MLTAMVATRGRALFLVGLMAVAGCTLYQGDPPRPGDDATTAPTAIACAGIWANPDGASDAELVACGRAQHLGACIATDGATTNACELYVKLTDRCSADGTCPGPPLSGTGCADEAYYGADHEGTTWNCTGEPAQVAACMLRRLIAWGDCGEPPRSICSAVFADPASASTDQLLTCGLDGELGSCVAVEYPPGVCDYYVKNAACTDDGLCGAPLDGTGCASSTWYGEAPWHCDQADDADVAACMLRQLITWGDCQP